MSKNVLYLLVLLVGLSFSQWSAPVVIGEHVTNWGSGPVAAPTCGDSVWAIWVNERDLYSAPVARLWSAGAWSEAETVVSENAPFYYPAAVGDDSGWVGLAYYEGSYPTTCHPDSWGIYLAVRGPTGWNAPFRVFPCDLTGGFARDIRLGRGSSGTIGMVWTQGSGMLGAVDSAMFSYRNQGTWIPRHCVAPGTYPNINCGAGALIAGDTTEFLLTYVRRAYPDLESVYVGNVSDTLFRREAAFAGGAPMLGRFGTRRYLTFMNGPELLVSENLGSGWSVPWQVTADADPDAAVRMRSDPVGYVWMSWANSARTAILASYNGASFWSEPETVATGLGVNAPVVVSDGNGAMRAVWLEYLPGGYVAVMSNTRLGRPGIADKRGDDLPGRQVPSVVGQGRLAERLRGARLRDVNGRLVAGPAMAGPGVYFLVGQSNAPAVKVVVAR